MLSHHHTGINKIRVHLLSDKDYLTFSREQRYEGTKDNILNIHVNLIVKKFIEIFKYNALQEIPSAHVKKCKQDQIGSEN